MIIWAEDRADCWRARVGRMTLSVEALDDGRWQIVAPQFLMGRAFQAPDEELALSAAVDLLREGLIEALAHIEG